jgi:c-di-GMP-related signal transduction protein
MSTTDSHAGTFPDAAAPGRLSGLIARQPILDAQRAVVAYELFDRSTGKLMHDASSDIALIFNAMADTSHELGIESKTIFINRTHQSLLNDSLELVKPERVVLKIAPVPGHEAQAIQLLQPTLAALRARGFRLAFTHTVVAPAYASWQPLADYVKLDLLNLKPALLKPLITAVQTRTPAQIIAEKIETPEQFSAVEALGLALFQGYWFGQPTVVKTRVIAPAQASVLQLFNLVRNQAETDEIETLLKRDAMLGFNLLRLLNSAGFGLSQQVTSFRHAVMLMGLKRLFRWAALLLTASRAHGSAPVVGTTAIVRGRMMELLGAGTLSPEDCDSAFIVGVFSLLDEMLGMPMADALNLLSLPPHVQAALAQGSGVLGRMLALTKAAESSDEATFAAATIALDYSSHHVNTAHLEALVWADSLAL